ncbi:MAG: hypothetical protein R3E50_02525 [Halioglobus sp.]
MNTAKYNAEAAAVLHEPYQFPGVANIQCGQFLRAGQYGTEAIQCRERSTCSQIVGFVIEPSMIQGLAGIRKCLFAKCVKAMVNYKHTLRNSGHGRLFCLQQNITR